MLHFFGLRQQNTQRQATQAKTQAPSLKIRTSIRLNLAKIGLNQFKQKHEKYLRDISEVVKQQVYLQILDAMLGSDWRDKDVWKQKLQNLKQGHYNDHIITVLPGWKCQSLIQMGLQPQQVPQRPITKQVKQIFEMLYQSYFQKINHQISHNFDPNKEAIKFVEQEGIIFLDQIDKLAVPQTSFTTGKGVSTEGVQRDLLPLLEGTVINTKLGEVKTDHILFIASGSFSMAKVQDLIPELLGRLPVRVKLNPISYDELVRILTEPQYNLLMQQTCLLKSENVDLKFDHDAICEMARIAYEINQNSENLGARRLHAIVEKVIEDLSFEAPDKKGETVTITKQYVVKKLQNMNTKVNLAKFLI